MPETSIIIRTFNEEKYFEGLLEAVRRQSYQDYEIIVVDSGSYDRTREIAQRYAHKLVRIKSEDFTYGYALNVGISAAEGQYAVAVSAHTLPLDDRWLGKLVRPFEDPKVAMVYGRQVGWETSKFSDAQDLRRTFGAKRSVLRPPHYFANNANSALRRSLWKEHPFDEALAGLEDIDWARYWMRKDYLVVYEPEAALHHMHEDTWRQVRKRYFVEGVAAKSLGLGGPLSVPKAVAVEGARLVGDIFRANGHPRKVPEIALYRAHKLAGTVKGLTNGKVLKVPERREAFFFDAGARAVVISGPGRAELTRVQVPRLKPGEVLIRVQYSGVALGDVALYEGKHNYVADGVFSYPIVPGQEVSGRVMATGVKVSTITEGANVVVMPVHGCGQCADCKAGRQFICSERRELGLLRWNGGYAEYVVAPSSAVRQLPPDLDSRRAVLAPALSVVLKGLNRIEKVWPTSPGPKRCAVVGVGPLGHLAARVLSHRGHDVTVFDRNERRLSYFSDSNIHTSQDLEELGRFEALVETTGDPVSLERMLRESPSGAAILVLGVPYAHRRFTFQNEFSYDKTLVGSVGSDMTDIEEAIGLLPHLPLEQYVGHILLLSEFRQGWDAAKSREHLKTILQVGQ
jgi:2-desacetyl-2-hydroxyethyl bacteriochlorophyllide A dehydrogenase